MHPYEKAAQQLELLASVYDSIGWALRYERPVMKKKFIVYAGPTKLTLCCEEHPDAIRERAELLRKQTRKRADGRTQNCKECQSASSWSKRFSYKQVTQPKHA